MLNTMKPDDTWVKHVADSQYKGFTLDGLATGETITSATVAVTPTGSVTVTTPAAVVGANVSSLISGGVAGKEYRVRFTILTSNHPAIVKDLLVKVIA